MILWTIIPTEDVFSGYGATKPTYKEIRQGHMTMIVEPDAEGYGTLVRLISPDCNDYLNPALAPGAKIRL
ncbi:YlzJ-like family protein [Fodinisporobacter ferrooxydans]|uniref:YlzJ-like family protein n=1 Tax=Fodinisporobacter ferrooxydans TaxID=2901836 RepID=A0ABY4CFU6_9BACL|nr:YlzJ-like family protein [Alicyclobacillaceae bacterium MYW30-H2]